MSSALDHRRRRSSSGSGTGAISGPMGSGYSAFFLPEKEQDPSRADQRRQLHTTLRSSADGRSSAQGRYASGDGRRGRAQHGGQHADEGGDGDGDGSHGGQQCAAGAGEERSVMSSGGVQQMGLAGGPQLRSRAGGSS